MSNHTDNNTNAAATCSERGCNDRAEELSTFTAQPLCEFHAHVERCEREAGEGWWNAE